MFRDLVPVLRELILYNKMTTSISLLVTLYLAYRWNMLHTEEIVVLLVSSLSLGLAKDPNIRGGSNELD